MTQNNLQTLLEDAQQAGIFHLPESGRPAVRLAAAAAGFACFEVDLGHADQIGSALAQLGYELEFPDWYGRNFDALKDCLTDFSWHEAPGYVLIVSGAETLQAEDPAAFQSLNEVFVAAIQEWREQGYPLWIFYDLRADGFSVLPTLA